MTRGSMLAVCVTFMLATTVTRVAAQPRTGSAADRRAAAQQKFIEASDLAQAGDHEAAIRGFEEAYEILPLDDFLFNIASVHRARGDTASALVYYHRYLSAAPNGRAAALARTRIAEIEAASAQRVEADRQAPDDGTAAARPPQVGATVAPADAVMHRFEAPEVDAALAAARTRSRRLRIGGLTTVGAGVLALGVGLHFFVRDADTTEPYMYTSVATGLALVAGGGALYYYGTRPTRETRRERAAVIAPVPVVGGAGVAVAGSF